MEAAESLRDDTYTVFENDLLHSQAVRSLLHGARTLLFYSYPDWQRVSRNGRRAGVSIAITWTKYPYFESYDGFKSARAGLVESGILECIDRGNSLYGFSEAWRGNRLSDTAKSRIEKPLEAIAKRAARARNSRERHRPAVGARGEAQPHHGENMECGSTSTQGEAQPHHGENMECGSTSPQDEAETHHGVSLNLVRGEVEPPPIPLPIQTTTTKRAPQPRAAALSAALPDGGGVSAVEQLELGDGPLEWPGGGLPRFNDKFDVTAWARRFAGSLTPRHEAELARIHDDLERFEGAGAPSRRDDFKKRLTAGWAEARAASKDIGEQERRMAKIAAGVLGEAGTRQTKRVCDCYFECGMKATHRAVLELASEALSVDDRFKFLMARAKAKKGDAA